jgi:hypothetical protein
MIHTFWAARSKQAYRNHHGGPPVDRPIQFAYEFDVGSYLTRSNGFQPGFAEARLFPTAAKAKQNVRSSSSVIKVDDFDAWFEIVPVEVKEPA